MRALLEYLLQRGEEGRALAVLRRPNISHELVYKFAPVPAGCTLGRPVIDGQYNTISDSCAGRSSQKLPVLHHCGAANHVNKILRTEFDGRLCLPLFLETP